jgi:hypothetical protein
MSTYWEHNGQRITLNEVLRFIAWHKILAKPLLVNSLVSLATSPSARYTNSTSKEPIIVITRDTKPIMILDGHHRVQQAFRANDATIAGYIIDVDTVPLEWRTAIVS